MAECFCREKGRSAVGILPFWIPVSKIEKKGKDKLKMGELIRQARKEKDLTQLDLARKILHCGSGGFQRGTGNFPNLKIPPQKSTVINLRKKY